MKKTYSDADLKSELEIVRNLLDKKNLENLETKEELESVVKELAVQITKKEEKVLKLAEVNKDLAHQIEIKEKKTAELEVVIQELEFFSYSVSHDLRSPLRAINGFSRIILEEYGHDFEEELKFYFDEILSNSEKMGELIDSILEFSRIAKHKLSYRSIDTNSTVNSIIRELRNLEPDRDFEIKIKDLPGVSGDKNMIRQAFFNLLQNAFKYTGKKEIAVIEVGSYLEEDNTVFYVRDNGAGFDEQYSNKLFGVFQRLHSSKDFEGTGVGLATVEKIITKHNGRVWAESKVNEGACFYISIPVNVDKE